MSDNGIEIRKLNDTMKEINKTLNRQNSLLEKMLRFQVLDYEEGQASRRRREEGAVPSTGEGDWPAGSPSRQGQPSLQPGAPVEPGQPEAPKGYQIFGE
jgi:hypothetical protein